MSRKFRTARVLTALYLLTALGMSYTHIAALFLHLGAGWQSFVVAALIDTVIIIGKLSAGPGMSAGANRSAHRAVTGGLFLSLSLNITIGVVHRSVGEVLAGLIVVGGALWAEQHMSHHRPKAVRAPRKPADKAAATRKANAAKRSAAARKAAVTRKANAAKVNAELAQMAAGQ